MKTKTQPPKQQKSPSEPRPTKMQRKIALTCVEHQDWTGQEILAHCGFAPSVCRHPRRVMDAPGTQRAIAEVLTTMGITDQKVISRLRESLDADREQVGEGAVHVSPDHAIRLRAVELVCKLKGWIKTEQANQLIVVVGEAAREAAIMYVPPERRADYMRFIASRLLSAGGTAIQPVAAQETPGRAVEDNQA